MLDVLKIYDYFAFIKEYLSSKCKIVRIQYSFSQKLAIKNFKYIEIEGLLSNSKYLLLKWS